MGVGVGARGAGMVRMRKILKVSGTFNWNYKISALSLDMQMRNSNEYLTPVSKKK